MTAVFPRAELDPVAEAGLATHAALTTSAHGGLVSSTLASGQSIIRTYLGTGNLSSFTSKWRPATSSDDLPVKIICFFGGAGSTVPGTTQGFGAIAKYFNATTEDSAQAGSAGAFLVDNGVAPYTQTLPLTGMEGDAVTQGANVLNGNAVGMAAIAQAQGTSRHTGKTIAYYAGAGGARDAGASVAAYYGLYVEDVAGAGAVVNKWGVYSRLKIQSETMIWTGVFLVGSTLASGISVGATSITVQAGDGPKFVGTGVLVVIGTGTAAEVTAVQSVAGDVVSVSAVANAHSAGEVILPTQAANIRFAAGQLVTDYGFSAKVGNFQQLSLRNADGTGFVQFTTQSVAASTPGAGLNRIYFHAGAFKWKGSDGVEHVLSDAAALAVHEADTTAVHGIADTAAIVLTADARLSDQRIPTALSITDAKVAAGADLALTKIGFGAYKSTLYYGTPNGVNGTSAGQGNGTLRATPFLVTHTTTFDRIACEITVVGSSGALVRLGIYADDGTIYPGALVLDAGTVDGTILSTTTARQITISQQLTPGLYWLVSVIQGAPVTQPTVRTCGASSPVVPIGGLSAIDAAGAAGYSQSGVTGALPGNFSTTVAAVPSATRVTLRAA